MSKKHSWFEIKAKQNVRAEGTTAEIYIYGDIGESWYGETVAAKDFVKELAALEADNITIRINSIGGSVTDGIAIYNAIKRHSANVTVAIDGLAASIASLIAMAGDTVQMADNAQIMIHAPWMYAGGNSAELRKYADMLDGWAESMATSYAAKSGQTKDEVLQLLTDGEDHWYGAEAAKTAGFIDEITNSLAVAASFDLALLQSRFRSVSAQLVQAIPAAAAAQPTKENQMPTTGVQPAAPAAQAVTDEAAILAKGRAEEASRRESIAKAFSKFTTTEGVPALLAECHADISCTVQAANDRLLTLLGSASAPAAGNYVVTIEDEYDKFKAGVGQSLLARANIIKPESAANPFRGYTLYEIARASLERQGVKTNGMGKMEVVAAAFTHSSSDFGNLLANVAQKAMMKGFEEAEETFQLWTVAGTLPDFKAGNRVDLNSFPALDKVAEGAEYKYATIGDRGEQIQLATYGKLFSITRQAIINDDLDAFSKIPMRMGRAAIRTVGDLVYAILTGNPTMSDGVALFHATHKNLLTGAAISTPAVDAMRVAMATQKRGGGVLNIRLANLLVPVALEGTASVVRDSEFEVGASTRNNTTPNSVRGTFNVISDARLDVASATTWYGAANPAVADTVEVAYLDGNQAPTLEQQSGWNIDGVEFKVRMDAGVKALASESLAKNPGA